mmetsp:Transcript_35881/g.83670  ORF Transcript_35881/g.83670 Transcript_35881/m.83670 type:complete len:1105 (-) Transcript_35881:446-3760(-)
MHPGVECFMPNSTASFVRRCVFIERLHSDIGDDELVRLLSRCTLLMPCALIGPGSMARNVEIDGVKVVDGERKEKKRKLHSHHMHDGATQRQSSWHEIINDDTDSNNRELGGNYIQLSGEPLSQRVRQWTGSKVNNDDGANDSKEKKKRQKTSSSSSVLSGNVCLPRHKIFYSDTFVPRVGLPLGHLFHKKIESAEEENVLLMEILDDMLCLTKANVSAGGSENNGNHNYQKMIARTLSTASIESKGRHDQKTSSQPMKQNDQDKDDGDPIAKERSETLRTKKIYRRKRLKRVMTGGALKTCRDILKSHRSCDYARLLARYAPLPSSVTNKTPPLSAEANDGGYVSPPPPHPTLSELVRSHSPRRGVVRFASSVLTQVFPIAFWGSARNRDACLENVGAFLSLRRRERFTIKAMMHGVKIMDVVWARPRGKGRRPQKIRGPSDHEAATDLMTCALRWVYVKFLIPLLRATFYITETEHLLNKVVYYRKPVWTALYRQATAEMLRSKQYEEISEVGRELSASSDTVGLSELRILPKKTGVRPIALLSRAAKGKVGENGKDGQRTSFAKVPSPSSNVMLRDAFHALDFERRRKPHLFGYGMLGFSHALPRLKHFLSSFAVRFPGLPPPMLYLTSVDIQKCFDNIHPGRLFSALRHRILSEDRYLFQKAAAIHPFAGRLNGRSLRATQAFSSAASPFLRDFPSTVAAEVVAGGRHHCVFVDGVVGCAGRSREKLLELLEKHIFNNVVLSRGPCGGGGRRFRQMRGIPQGSILSSLFCNFFYGDAEGELLQGVFDHEDGRCATDGDVHRMQDQSRSLLIRVMDDYLLMSNSKATSLKFLDAMNKGMPHLGIQINKTKTNVNYNIGPERLRDNLGITTLNGNEPFPWCGLLLDPLERQISLDFSRFSGPRVSDGLTVDLGGGEGNALRRRMQCFVWPRLARSTSAFLDSTLNSQDTIDSNLYGAMLLCAAKSVHYVRHMRGGFQSNPEYVVRCIEELLSYSYALTRNPRQKKLEGEERAAVGDAHCTMNDGKKDPLSDGNKTPYVLPRWKVEYLGHHAFVIVFKLMKERNLKAIVLSLKQKMKYSKFVRKDKRLKKVIGKTLKDFKAVL